MPEEGLRDHIIIIGYGRVGRYTADIVQQLSIPCVVIDQDYQAVEEAKAAGLAIVYGDASSSIVLEAAHIHAARLTLIVVSTALDVDLIVRAVRQLNPDLHTVVRATHRSQIEQLQRLGIHEIVQPELEAGLEIVRQALLHFDISVTQIEQLSNAVRNEHYQSLDAIHPGADVLRQLRHARNALDIAWFTVTNESPLVDQSIGENAIRRRTGASIVAVLRGNQVITNPDPDTVLHAGDCVGVLSTVAQRHVFHTLLESAAPVIPAAESTS